MGTAADVEYRKLLLEGKPPKEAAKIAQERTGISLVSGKPIKSDLPYKVKYAGQYK
jgi:hypothetical protein